MVYQGSKRLYAKYIVPILQKTIEENKLEYFYDTCVGGSHIIDKIQCPHKIGGDINPYLIALYQYAQKEHQWPETISRDDWEKARWHPEECEPWFVGLVEFFTSYSAKGFVGGYCMGSSRDYYHERLRNFEKQIPLLLDIEYRVMDINTWSCPTSPSCIYIDPPYYRTSKYDYNLPDRQAFWTNVRKLSLDNFVFISETANGDVPEDFEAIWTQEVSRVNFGKHKATKSTEVLWRLKNDIKKS